MTTAALQPATSSTSGRIVVGVADTDETDPAVRFAADHAARTGATLHLVHAFVWPLMNVDVDPVPGIAGSGLRAATDTLLNHFAALARAAAPGVTVTSEVVDGRALDVLLEASADADAIVVGSRGLGRVLALVMGSTSIGLASRSEAPVVIVRGEPLTDGPIGVAYEASDIGRLALERAGRLAELHGADVHVIIGSAIPADQHDRILRSARTVIGKGSPEVTVELAQVPTAADARQLVDASEGMRMLVVPARSDEAVSASSRTGALLQYAHTPIWVERPERTAKG